MKTLTILLALTVTTTVNVFAQRATAGIEGNPEVELLIVRNNDGCEDCESFIYEKHGERLKKVAFLYPDQAYANSRANLYNSKMIQQVLTEYSINGYEISSSSVENFDGACNKRMTYKLENTSQTLASSDNWN